MAVQRLNMEEIPDSRGGAGVTSSSAPPNKTAHDVLLAMFTAISAVLAVRLFLFLSLIGTFVLAIIAIYDKSTASLWVVIAYAFLTTGPLAFLEWRGKKGGG